MRDQARRPVVAALLAFFFLFPGAVQAAASADAGAFTPPDNQYYRAVVTAVLAAEVDDDPFIPVLDQFSQLVRVKFTEGPRKSQSEEIRYVPGSTGDAAQDLREGDKVLVVQTDVMGEAQYYIADRDRFGAVLWLALAFFAIVVVFAGWKGVRSVMGLAFTIAVIMLYIVPRVVEGGNPFVTFLMGGLLIACVSIYLGHGFNRRTTIAVVSTLITLTASVGVSAASIRWTKLFGLGSEEAFYLQVSGMPAIDLRGLLLGGFIIGILGVLDDITTAQAATVEEIHKANPALNVVQLVRRGLSVGHEHIVSLVNTLALAYVGASFPLLLLFMQSETPLWVVLNSERITEEIVRTLVGSSALVIAVPITTYLAAWVFSRYGTGKEDAAQVPHAHRH